MPGEGAKQFYELLMSQDLWRKVHAVKGAMESELGV